MVLSGDITKMRTCYHCKIEVKAQLVRNITASRVSQVYWRCPTCHYHTDGSGICLKHDLVSQYVDINSLPIIDDYSKNVKCAYEGCANVGAEYHHFAPHFLFPDDADKWPTAYLCKPHHDLWHNALTPNMSGNKREK